MGRWVVGLSLVLGLLLTGCGAGPPAPAGTPPPARFSGADAVATLRDRLRSRGYDARVTGGPMGAVWDELAPPSPQPGGPAIPAALRGDGPGAWLVATEGGEWWVWQTTDQGPLRDQRFLTAW